MTSTSSSTQTPDRFYRAADPRYTIYDSMLDSVRSTVERTLTWCRGNLCGKSSFADPDGTPPLWHEFGPLEGPGWACNALGGAVEFGDVNNTEPFLNNQHIASPTPFHLEQLARRQTRDAGAETEYRDHESNLLARMLRVG